jgi:Asp-tRNA(Asn)/Glu-tRNA(Gln) amidotransferase C subunit
MNPERVERIARELAAELPLSDDEWKAIATQARDLLAVVATLDELPLERVEPAATYHISDAS